MLTKIIKKDVDWIDIKNVSRTTVNKQYSEKDATDNFKINMMISEHSPIRLITFRWKWSDIKSWIATHWSRHKYECFIGTQRNDRTGVDRDYSFQGETVPMDNSANAQNLIDASRKRLCHQSHKETTYYAEDLKNEISKEDPEVAFVLTPNCIYRCGCSEFKSCGLFDSYVKRDINCSSTNIIERYTAYNKLFKEDFIKTHGDD